MMPVIGDSPGLLRDTPKHELSNATLAGDTGLWFGLAALGFILVLFEGSIWPQPHDFGPFYTAEQIYLHYSPDRMYDLDLEREIEKRAYNISEPKLAERFLPYNHLPYEVFLWMPLDGLSPSHAFWMWRLFNVVLLIGTLALLGRIIPSRRSLTQLVLIALAFFPVPYCLLAGQDTFVTLALLTVSAWLLHLKREFMAGVVLGVGLFKFPLILPIIGIFFLLRHWRLVCGFVASATVWLGISTVMVGPKGMRDLVTLWSLGEKGGIFCITPRTMPNIRGFLINVVSLRSTTALVITVLISAALLLMAAYQLRHTPNATDIFALGSCFVLLVSFHTNLHDLVLLVFPMLIFLEKHRAIKHPRWAGPLVLFLLFNPLIYVATLLAFKLPYLCIIIGVLWLALTVADAETRDRLPEATTMEVVVPS